jgi:8-oxo-dGTP diphosphatase
MISLRLMSTALLFNEQGSLLMMKRSPYRTLSPGKWAAVGGHVEPDELRTPTDTCFREIFEETGIRAEQIHGLQMRYVLLRLFGNEIRQQFFYTGRTVAEPTVETDEGDLHWVPRDQIFDRDMPFIFRALLKHYFEHEHDEGLWVGTAYRADGEEPTIVWLPFVDPGTI